jgi:hypothetical protein
LAGQLKLPLVSADQELVRSVAASGLQVIDLAVI